MRIITGPSVQLGLDPPYPALRLIEGVLQLRIADIHRRTPRHSSLLTADMLVPFPMCTGSPRLGVLRDLRPTHGPQPATDLPTRRTAPRGSG